MDCRTRFVAVSEKWLQDSVLYEVFAWRTPSTWAHDGKSRTDTGAVAAHDLATVCVDRLARARRKLLRGARKQ